MKIKEKQEIAYKAGLEAGITDYQSEVREGSWNLNPFKHGSDLSINFSMGYIDGFINGQIVTTAIDDARQVMGEAS